ncbi:hypothetical protein CUU95_00370 [Vreelandella alkaliphila]|nr:hypothetical protein CUU95_00370 [Halomonas alkaliphila]
MGRKDQAPKAKHRAMLPTMAPVPAATHAALLSPRPARALNVVVFMHPCTHCKAAPLLGWLGKNGRMKIMRFHADLCTSVRYA